MSSRCIPPGGSQLPDREELDTLLAGKMWQLRVKRVVDIVIGGMLLVICTPLILAAGGLIRVESPGPMLFKQLRFGRDSRQFVVYKLRTMRPDVADDAAVVDDTGRLRKSFADPRVTRVGRLLRRTSIDELPQLWNVVRGDMSLVGPRPLMVPMLNPYPDIQAIRGTVRPGLTGLWQISDRMSNTHVLSMIEYDLDYILRLSLTRDVRILLLTVVAVFSRRGAV